MPFTTSPLFQTATKEFQSIAKQQFAKTNLGRLVDQATRAGSKQSATKMKQMDRTLEQFRRGGASAALRELRGTPFGQLAGQVQRYSRGNNQGMDRLLKDFLDQLGPVGKLLGALGKLGGPQQSDESKLADVMRSLGWEVIPQQGTGSPEDTKRGIAASIANLVFHGYTIMPPGGGAGGGAGGAGGAGGVGGASGGAGGGGIIPPGGSGGPGGAAGGGPRQTVWELPQKAQLPTGLPPDHPAITGEMIDARNSSNVHSVGYDSDASLLYVRFLGGRTQQKSQGYERPTSTPGPLYRYEDVSFREFNDLLHSIEHPGEWVWDHLRVRGSHVLHQKRYALVGIEGGYVPRRAGTNINEWSGKIDEYFKRRQVRGLDGNVFESVFPTELAPSFGFGPGQVSWGMRPDRGTPQRSF